LRYIVWLNARKRRFFMDSNALIQVAGGYGPPPGGGGFGPPPGGGGFGPPPGGGGFGPPPDGGGFGPPPGGGGGYGGPPGFGGPPGGGGYGGPPGGPIMPGAGGDVNTTLPIILGVLESILCCNALFGIGAIVLGVLASSDLKTGNIEDARNKVNIAYIVLGVGAFIGIFSGLFGWGFVLSLFGAALSGNGH
jgi:hypothetical protein